MSSQLSPGTLALAEMHERDRQLGIDPFAPEPGDPIVQLAPSSQSSVSSRSTGRRKASSGASAGGPSATAPGRRDGRIERRDGFYDLEAVAVVDRSATICLPTLGVEDGGLREAAVHIGSRTGAIADLIRHAYAEQRLRKASTPIRIRGLMNPDEEHAFQMAAAAADHYRTHGGPEDPQGPGSPIEHSRHSGRVISVS